MRKGDKARGGKGKQPGAQAAGPTAVHSMKAVQLSLDSEAAVKELLAVSPAAC